MRTKEVKKLKINAESIRSTLFNNNKKLIKLRKNENTLLRRINNDKKKEKKEGFIEGIRKGFLSNLGKTKKKVAGKSKSMFSKIMEFFGLISAAVLLDKLPELIEGVKKFFADNEDTIESIQSFFKNVSDAIIRFVSFFETSPFNKDKLEDDKKNLSEKLKDIREGDKGLSRIEKDIEGLKEIASGKEEEMLENKKSNEKISKEAAKEASKEGENQVGKGIELSEGTAKQVREEVTVSIGQDTNNNKQDKSENNNKLVVNNNEAKVEGYNKGGTAGYLNSPLTSRGESFNTYKKFRDNTLSQSSLIDDQHDINNSLLDIIQVLLGTFKKPTVSDNSSLRNTTMKMLGAYEGLSLNAYKDTEGIPTIGFGATTLPTWITGENKDRPVKMGDTITTEQAYKLKDHDYNRHRVIVEDELSEVGISLDKLPVNVSSVLMSLAFNYGSLKGAHSGTNTVFNGRKFPDSLPVMVKKAYTSNDYSNIADLIQLNLIHDNSGDLTNRRLSEANIIRTGSGTGFFGLQDLNLPLNSSSKSSLFDNKSSNSQFMQYDVSKIQRSPVLSTEMDDNLTIISIRDQVIIPIEV
tara:strand:- start:3728 stop:5467 length:1740 start_codon:yes stop_codon:yes gene_type:complete